MNRLLCLILALIALSAAARAQATAADKPHRIRVSYAVLDGLAIKRALPAAPCSTDKSHRKGTVRITILTDYDGKVKNTTPTSGDPVLIECASHAISQWQFEPYLVNGTPVQVESHVDMKFTPKRIEVIIPSR